MNQEAPLKQRASFGGRERPEGASTSPHVWGHRRPPVMVPLAALAVIVLLWGSMLAFGSSVQNLAPPYVSATSVTAGWANSTSYARANLTSRAAANATSGGISMAMNAWATKSTAYSASVVGLAGFEIPFSVAASGTQRVSTNWTLGFSTSVYGQSTCSGGFRPTCTSTTETVVGLVYFVVLERTNGTMISAGASPAYFVDLSVGAAASSSSGTVNVSMNLTGAPVHGHSYDVLTYVGVSVSAKGYYAILRQVQSRPFFSMIAPSYGGKLLTVTVA
jgi:hypothetical protein